MTKSFLSALFVALAALVAPSVSFAAASALPELHEIRALNITDTIQAAPSDHTSTLHAIIIKAKNRVPGALADYCQFIRASKTTAIPQAIQEHALDLSEREQIIRDHLAALASLVFEADSCAAAALVSPDYDNQRFHKLVIEALTYDHESHSLAVEAVESIANSWSKADAMVKTREDVFAQYQEEIRRGEVRDGTRLAWSLIRIGASHPDTRIVPGSFQYDTDSATIRLTHLGNDVEIRLTAADLRQRFRATVDGYSFRSGWAVLFQKPLGWMTTLARAMAEAGIDPDYQPEWEVMEAPEGLVALATGPEAKHNGNTLRAFYKGKIREVTQLPVPEDAGSMTEEFLAAAQALHDGIMGDETISSELRSALKPVLMGTFQPVDPRNYFDSDFCRRLIEADYLEAHIQPLGPERRTELEQYRQTLARIESGVDRFSIDLDGDDRLVAVTRPEIDARNGEENDIRDAETGETLSPYQWRLETTAATLFHSPLVGRGYYAMSLMERFSGRHTTRPVGVPETTEVWHALLGCMASYQNGAPHAEGDKEKWLEAVTLDARGGRDTTAGPLGWSFPLHVPVQDDQGDPVLIATLAGVVESPEFSSKQELAERRRAQDAWLDEAARVLAEPGELALIYRVFFRYCSDSPLPELPNLIGSYYGLSDTHQTVYESLERRWVGRLIGDCDDLAEVFQTLALRQGKLAHVMQLPGHAAAGWLDETPDGRYEFIVLQTGPALRFVDSSRIGAVEKAYRHFDTDSGDSHFTAAAVPLLLRFADEETRTPFVLSARIYWDADYAEEMIKVQEYWHLHTFSAGVAAMEEIVASDRQAGIIETGNLKELASLYERVARYAESDAIRREELAAAEGDIQAALSARLDIAQLHIHGKNDSEALKALAAIEEEIQELRTNDPKEYARAAAFRYACSTLLSRQGEPERAWELLRPDVEASENKLSDHLLRTLVGIYDRMSIDRDAGTKTGADDAAETRHALREVLDKAFGQGYFKADDSYNKIAMRYFWLARYGVATEGRKAGLAALWQDGPYPEETRKHADRTSALDDGDWQWFRILPRLYLAYGLEMLDREEYPERYDPVAARRSLEAVARAQAKSAALGINVMGRDAEVKSELVLAFLRRDLPAFSAVMAKVRSADYSSLYDDAAMTFGMYCGLTPLDGFGDWLDAFRKFFPGKQHYFKAAYRAAESGHFAHAELMAEATAGFFADDELLVNEADALKEATERLRQSRREQGWDNDWVTLDGENDTASRE